MSTPKQYEYILTGYYQIAKGKYRVNRKNHFVIAAKAEIHFFR